MHQLQDIDCNSTFVDFFALRTYLACQNNQETSPQWFPDNKKILFLMGKYYKPHRIGLLYRLYLQGLLTEDKCLWSLHQKIDATNVVKFIPRRLVNQSTLNDFLTICHNTLDPIKVVIQNDYCSHYGGFPFDANLYKTTNVSLISETSYYGISFITEKTYRAIINHHPFVVAGPAHQLRELQNLGFHTFNNFMKFPEYDDVLSTETRLDIIAENVKHFDPTGAEIKEITAMVDYNAKHFYNFCKAQSAKLQNMLECYGVTESWENVIPWRDDESFFLTWQFYYQTIKDPSWPCCYSIEDCKKLPEHIQQELATVFKVNFER